VVSLLTISLTNGIMIRDVGKPMTKPVANARTHLSKKPGTRPRFTMVRTRDIVKDIPNDINAPNKTVEYLLSIHTNNHHPSTRL